MLISIIVIISIFFIIRVKNLELGVKIFTFSNNNLLRQICV